MGCRGGEKTFLIGGKTSNILETTTKEKGKNGRNGGECQQWLYMLLIV